MKQQQQQQKYCDLFRDGEKGGKLETLRQTAKNLKEQIYIYIRIQTAKVSVFKTGQFNTVGKILRIIKSLELHFIMFSDKHWTFAKGFLKLFSLSLSGSSHSPWPLLFSVNIKKMADNYYKLENSVVVKLRKSGI